MRKSGEVIPFPPMLRDQARRTQGTVSTRDAPPQSGVHHDSQASAERTLLDAMGTGAVLEVLINTTASVRTMLTPAQAGRLAAVIKAVLENEITLSQADDVRWSRAVLTGRWIVAPSEDGL